jgi:short-subunit dehydrogenase
MKVTLITGASSGIGEAFARRLAADGHDLVLTARSQTRLHEICDELMLRHRITAHYIVLDLAAAGTDERLFAETEKHGFEVEWLINSAGFGSMGDFSVLDIDHELNMIRVNVLALTALTHRYLTGMRNRGKGTIINVSSAAGFQPIPFMATYAATKAYVTSFAEALAQENRAHGIRVMAICPGPTKTNFFRASKIDDPLQIKGVQTAEEVVNAALKGLKKGKSKVISGWANVASSILGRVVPTSVSTRVIARSLRNRF